MPNTQSSISLYIHIPFCLSKCPYCNFNSILWQESYWEGFVKAVYEQAKRLRAKLDKTLCTTLYFGGGTPSILSYNKLSELMELLCECFDISCAKELTIEANPKDINLHKIRQWKSLGINRVSIGVQSFSDGMLEILGRRHNSSEALKAVELTQDIFGDRVSIDLMFAVPGQDITQWEKDLLKAVKLGLKHISLYCLTIEKQTQFYYRYGDLDLSEISAQMYKLADELLSSYGLFWYEISNFAYPGCESQHNLSYWLGREFIGLGPGAWSFVNGVRFAIDVGAKDYIEMAEQGFIYTYDRIAPHKRQKELALLRLRTKYGLPVSSLPVDWKEAMDCFIQRQWIEIREESTQEVFSLTLQGRLFADEIAIELI